MVFGITGGTGAGKTTALTALRDMGAFILDCDEIYHELLSESCEMKSAIEGMFPGVLENGRIDTKLLGERVFRSETELESLTALTQPFVLREVSRRIEEERARGNTLAAIDAISLFESGADKLCDVTFCVTAPADVRARRIMKRENISLEYAMLRINAQKPEAYFRDKCDRELYNGFASEEEFRDYCSGIFINTIKGAKKMSDRKDELFYKQKHIADIIGDDEKALSDEYCAKYMDYIGKAKTERLAVIRAIELAEKKGFRPLESCNELKAGDKVYKSVRGKSLMLAVIGKKGLEEGTNIAAAHIDSPRLDLKQIPLYEDTEMAYFKTHYYGGIRKYQWVALPLALHGVVSRKDGSVVTVAIGDDREDPIFYISDLLPHLAAKQSQKPLNEAITGESLNIILGSIPVSGTEGSDRVKLQIMEILNEKYGIVEEDFLSAELEAVPALEVREIGLDRSLIGSYGHDDRVCAFAELQAILDIDAPEKTAVCILADKEEIGSEGVSGMQSEAFECFMEDLCETQGAKLRRCFENSLCISADVTNAFDPTYPEVSDKRNNAKLNYGLGIAKFTGRGGKSGSNDASAEVVGKVRKMFADNGAVWQMCELGKVDEGGGGTVAKYMAKRNIDTIDAGVPVLAMHSPYEVVSKLDCYMTYKGMVALFLNK